jgi:HPt (histidine-containing phosphotransfer) domain-containing protein
MLGDGEACLAAGMNDYVSKPFERTALLATLAQWLPRETAPFPASSPLGGWLDTDHLDRLAGMMPLARFAMIVESYLTSIGPHLVEFRTLADAADFSGLARAAHGLKGTSGNLGTRELMRLSGALELAAKAEDGTTVLHLVPQLDAVAGPSAEALRAYLAARSGLGIERSASV